MKLIRCEEHPQIINLEKVTFIYFGDKDNKIYFRFDAMNKEEMNEVVWEFSDKQRYDYIKSYFGFAEFI